MLDAGPHLLEVTVGAFRQLAAHRAPDDEGGGPVGRRPGTQRREIVGIGGFHPQGVGPAAGVRLLDGDIGRMVDGQDVVAGTTDETVDARAAFEDVVAGAAQELVPPLAPFEDVVAGAAIEPVVAVTAVEPVVPRLAQQRVAPGAALQEIVAGAAREAVLAGEPAQHVRPLAAAQDIVGRGALDGPVGVAGGRHPTDGPEVLLRRAGRGLLTLRHRDDLGGYRRRPRAGGNGGRLRRRGIGRRSRAPGRGFGHGPLPFGTQPRGSVHRSRFEKVGRPGDGTGCQHRRRRGRGLQKGRAARRGRGRRAVGGRRPFRRGRLAGKHVLRFAGFRAPPAQIGHGDEGRRQRCAEADGFVRPQPTVRSGGLPASERPPVPAALSAVLGSGASTPSLRHPATPSLCPTGVFATMTEETGTLGMSDVPLLIASMPY